MNGGSVWATAFHQAKLVENEGAVAFADFFERREREKRLKLDEECEVDSSSTSTSASASLPKAAAAAAAMSSSTKGGARSGNVGDIGDDEDGEGGADEGACGSGYAQSRKISRFVQSLLSQPPSAKSNGPVSFATTTQRPLNAASGDSTSSAATATADNLGRQLCRQWLKFAYLGLGEKCNEATCQRKHEIIGNPMRLYKDYSFKGLTTAQRNSIIETVKKQQQQQQQAAQGHFRSDDSQPTAVSSEAQMDNERVDDAEQGRAIEGSTNALYSKHAKEKHKKKEDKKKDKDKVKVKVKAKAKKRKREHQQHDEE
jgi:hypothetical protein